jgi:hypothetical protein
MPARNSSRFGPRVERTEAMTARNDIQAITERIRERSKRQPRNLSRSRRPQQPARPPIARALLRQPRPRFRRLQPFGEGRARRRQGRQSRHHHLLQRHAVGASAVRDLSRSSSRRRRARAAASPRWPAACRPCATASRKGQPGMELSLFARRHRHGGGRRPQPQHVRRRRLSRRLRQDRARAW